MRAAAIIWCSSIPGLQVYLFRRLFPDLIKNHMEGPKGFRVVLAPWVRAGFVSIVEDEIRFWNGSKIYLCHCKDEKDRFKYQGAEIHVLMIDELTHFSDVIYRFLRGRVRQVGLIVPPQYAGMFPRILCGSNPGNIGHLWVKAAFIDDCPALTIRRMGDEEGGMIRQFIPARLEDNPSMGEDDPTYRARLRGLGSDSLVKAMEGGDWDVVVGAYFDCWDRNDHVVAPFEIPHWWTRFRAFDWGSAAPFSVGWWAISDGTVLPDGREYPSGAMIRYREWYGAKGPNEGLKLTAETVAEGIVKRSRNEKYAYSVADPSCFSKTTAAGHPGPSVAERMRLNKVSFDRADNQRLLGWDQMRARLIGDDRPMIYCFDTCIDSIRTIPSLQHDEALPEDLNTDAEDHAADEWRYACMSRPYTIKSPSHAPIRGTRDMTLNEAHKLARPKTSNSSGRI